jgi:hypothetical protein
MTTESTPEQSATDLAKAKAEAEDNEQSAKNQRALFLTLAGMIPFGALVSLLATHVANWTSTTTSSSTYLSNVLGFTALAGLLVALIGTLLRTFAHNRKDAKDLDLVGKCLAFAATGSAFTATLVSLFWSGLAIVGWGLLAVSGSAFVVVLIVVLAKGRKKKRAELEAGSGQPPAGHSD